MNWLLCCHLGALREHLDRQAGDRLLAGVSAAGRW
jgi:hypothetical protein